MSNDDQGNGNQAITEANPFASPTAFQDALDKISEESPDQHINENPDDTGKYPASDQSDPVDDTPDPKASHDDDDDDKPLIPSKVLRKEKERRRQADERALRAEIALENYTKALEAYMQPADNKDAAGDIVDEIDPLDPDAYKSTMKAIAALKKEIADMKESGGRDKESAAFGGSLKEQQQSFQAENPDFNAAYVHLLNSKCQDYMALGYEVEEAKTATLQEMAMKTKKAVENGKNAAELVYNMAKRSGYVGGQKKQAPKADVDINAIERNMKKSASIDDTPGAPTVMLGSDLSNPETLARLQKSPGKSIDPKKFQELLKQVERTSRN